MAKVNGERTTSKSDDSKKNKKTLSTKEPILNGTETPSAAIVNGDPKKNSECDISSSSDSAKVVTNGIINDSDDAKSSKSDEGNNAVLPKAAAVKGNEGKHRNEKKKDSKKVNATEKNNDTDKKTKPVCEKSVESKKDSKSTGTEIVNGDTNKIVNGDKERESSPSEDGDEKKGDAEVVFIHEMGFTVKIVSPGAEPLDIQVLTFKTHLDFEENFHL